MTANPEMTASRWESPEHVDSWCTDKVRQIDYRRLRAKLVSLLPFERGAAIRVLDVGCGDGPLSLDLLAAFPRAQLVCHDFSAMMLSRARQRLAPFAAQVAFAESDLRYPAWTEAITGTFDAVVSSVAIHDVIGHARTADHSRIQAIYSEVFGLVRPGGCFFNFEHVFPPGPVIERIYNHQRNTRHQELLKAETGVEKSLEDIEEEFQKWRQNRAGATTDSSVGECSDTRTVKDQIEWLRQAGFDEVDCLWKEMAGAIIGALRY